MSFAGFPWASLVLLGMYHGVNPGMGWLFAVSRWRQRGRWRDLLGSLVPLGVGHELSILPVAVGYELGAASLSAHVVTLGAAVVLLGLGGWFLLRRGHFRWVGMRLSARELVLWSFLMSSAEGAGLMLIPALRFSGVGDDLARVLGRARLGEAVVYGGVAAAVHGTATVATMGVVAVVVSRLLGLERLRRLWVNFDRIWAVALVLSGVLLLVT